MGPEAEHWRILDVRLCIRPDHMLEFRLEIDAVGDMDLIVRFGDRLMRLDAGGVASALATSFCAAKDQNCVLPARSPEKPPPKI